MAKLGAVAHYSARGDRNAHVAMEDDLENRGYAIWLACQGKVRTSKAPKTNGPADRGVGAVDGYEIEVNLKRKCFDLWPGLNQLDKQSQEAWTSELYAYLRASGNAICIKRPGLGEHGMPVWWLRETWNDVKAVGVYRPTQLTDREKRLSKTEAGEDREPSPVTVKQREDAAAAAEEKSAGSPEEAVTITASREVTVLAILKAAKEPLYQREIAETADLTNLIAGRILRDLASVGKVYRRSETSAERPDDASGRYRYLYWHKPRIPARKTPMDIGNQTMERVWGMKPGEQLRTSWMSPGNQAQVKELVEQGLLEYVDQGGPDEKIQLAPTTSSLENATEETVDVTERLLNEIVAEVKPEAEREYRIPELSMETPEETRLAMGGQPDIGDGILNIAVMVKRLVDEQVAASTGQLEQQLNAERAARTRAETALIAARTELSEAAHQRDEAQQKLNSIRTQLGL